jgi:hypothetical protein
MMHVYLRAQADALAAAVRRLAVEDGVWLWPRGYPRDRPAWVVVVLSVGVATMGWTPAEVRDLVAALRESPSG